MGDRNAIYMSHQVDQSQWKTLSGLEPKKARSEIQVRNLYFAMLLNIYIFIFLWYYAICCYLAILLCLLNVVMLLYFFVAMLPYCYVACVAMLQCFYASTFVSSQIGDDEIQETVEISFPNQSIKLPRTHLCRVE